MKITICYVTNRDAPHFEWFCDSFCAQTTPEQRANIQVVLVDGHCWSESQAYPLQSSEVPFADPAFHDTTRRRVAERIVAGRFPFLHVPPKPTAWQGPFRQTIKDFFCASNTRNTGFIVSEHPYIAFVDDLSVLMPQWFNQICHAAQDQYVVCGAYKKVLELRVENGAVVSFKPHLNSDGFDIGRDSRWDRGSDGGVVPWKGSGLYGCSFGIPLEAALEVDGFDGIGNGGGFEDCDFGLRVERAGWAFFYNRNMLTLESEEDHHAGEAPTKYRKIVTSDRLPKTYDSYKVPNEAEKYWSDHVMINRVCNETDRILPLLGDDLRVLRDRYQKTGMVPVPAAGQVDWRDGQPLSVL